jgi:archaellum component FlaC
MMNSSAQNRLYSIKQEIQTIINELEHISDGINRDFEGIGNARCASSVNRIAEHYKHVKRKLNNIDTSKVTEQFAKSHGQTR